MLDVVFHELRLATRGWARYPGFAAVAVLVLALGVGSAVAIFSIFHTVLLQPLPYPEPDRLVSIWETNPERGWTRAQVAGANFLDWREGATSFVDMAAHNDWLDELVLASDGEPTIALASTVTGNFFEVMGITPELGTVFDETHTWSGSAPAVVLSHGFWSQSVGADPEIIGKTLELDDAPYRVLGVMPEGFAHPFPDTEIWLPVQWEPALRESVRFRRAHGMRVVGRLRDDTSLEQARAELSAIAARLESDYPETNREMGTGAASLSEWLVGDVRLPISILMAAVGLVLLVACANVSNMLLARTVERREELEIKSALGGARSRLVLQELLSSLVLAAAGGGIGLLIGTWSIRPLLLLSPTALPRMHEVSANGTVALFAVSIAFGGALLCGSFPAWRAATLSSHVGTRGASASRRTRRLSAGLVALEVALSLPLVTGALLMARTLSHLSDVEPGFRPEGIAVASVMLPSTRYDDAAAIAQFYRVLHDELRGMAGASAAAMSSRLPFGNQRWSSDFTVDGWPAERYGVSVRHDEITPGLFRAMEVPLIEGRDFTTGDDTRSTAVVIVNEALAATYFPGESPIGKRVTFDREPDEDSTWRTIVGVVGNVRREALGLREKPSFYAPVLQDTTRRVHILVKARSGQDPYALVAAMRERLRAVDPALPLFDVTTLDETLEASVARERYLVTLLGVAAGVALGLASVGIFGVISYTTSRRSREISLRMALGARASTVVGLVLRSGLTPVVLGMAVGLVITAFTARAMTNLLYGVRPLDPLTFVVVAVIVLAVGVLACALPARRATRIDATAVLRSG